MKNLHNTQFTELSEKEMTNTNGGFLPFFFLAGFMYAYYEAQEEKRKAAAAAVAAAK